MSAVAFPEIAAACEPPERRGAGRDDVALLVARRSDGSLELARFGELARFLGAGDVLVVNDSATVPAALAGRVGGDPVVVHLSTPLGGRRWVVEVRGHELERIARPPIGMTIELGGGAQLALVDGYRGSARLAQAELVAPGGWIDAHAAPIRYGACPGRWPLEAYQTIFAREPGSAEMPSAARPFSAAIMAALAARGVLVVPLTLHAGVSSLERDEQPFPERFRVPARTAQAVNAARRRGGRIVAVGTTAVRALETAAGAGGAVEAAGGWTDVVITPERGLRVVDGLVTGWHEPESSHLWMLEAVAGTPLLERSYALAAHLGLRGHEFGDSHLILA